MKKSIKQALSLLLVAAMLVACIPSVLAGEDQTSGTVPVAITASTPTFSVTVPTTLPIHMDAYGDVTCGDITITNNSAGPVQVEDTQLTALNGWTLVDYDTTTFSDTDKGQHRVALQLDRDNGVTAAGADTGEDFIPAGGGQQTVSVAVKLPYQGIEMTDATVAQVVFVLGWYKHIAPLKIECADVTIATVDDVVKFAVKGLKDGDTISVINYMYQRDYTYSAADNTITAKNTNGLDMYRLPNASGVIGTMNFTVDMKADGVAEFTGTFASMPQLSNKTSLDIKVNGQSMGNIGIDVVTNNTGIVIGGSDSVVLGDTTQLMSTFLPGYGGTVSGLRWSSNKTSVATVDSNGLVTGVSIGTATISASCEGVTATKTIYVTKPSSVNGVKLFLSNSGYDCLSAGPQDAVNVSGDTYGTTFQVTTTNAHGHDHNVIVEIPRIDGWKTSSASVYFSQTENSTSSSIPLSKGSDGIWRGTIPWAMGWASLCGSFSASVSFTLTKSDDVYLRGLEIIGGSTMMMEETNQLTVKKLPENTTDTSDIVWSSSNTDVASVNDSGVVTSKKAGDTIITATCGGQSATKVIKVRQIFQLEVKNGYTGAVDTTITPIKEGDSYVANFKAEAFVMGGYATKLRVNPVYGPESNLDGYAWEMKVTVPDGEVFSFSGNGRSEWPDEFSLGEYNSGEVEVVFRATPS